MEGEVDGDLGEDDRRHRRDDVDAPTHRIDDEQRERRQAIERLQGVDRLDWQHQRAEPAGASIANHRAVPVLHLQKAAEPATPLAQEGADAAGRLGASLRVAEDAKAPVEAAVDGAAAQSMDELVVLDQAGRVEAADGDHRAAAKASERARDEEQALDLHPRVARQKVADVLVGLEPLETAAGERVPAHRRDDASDGDERGLGGEGAAHRADGRASSSVSASTVSTTSASMRTIASLSARALPPCDRRSQTRLGCSGLGALSMPGSGATKPYCPTSIRAVASIDPSSAMTICSGGSSCARSAARVTGSKRDSSRAATMTATLHGTPAVVGGRGRMSRQVCQPTKPCNSVS